MESLPAGTVLNERYRIERRIGLGGYGEVLAAKDLQTHLPVAIKILHNEASQNDPRAAARMRQEAGILMAINHPHIVRVLAIEDSPQGEFLVMERLDGETLTERLDKQGALEPFFVLTLTRQLLSALEFAHEKQVLHRDLKPDNILICYAPLSPTGEIAKLVDFGIAKAQAPLDEEEGEDDVTMVKTQIGSFVGTARYSAPEQLVGDPIGPQSDLFCLGLVIAEMLTNKRRIESDNFSEAMAQLIFPRPLDLSDCPEDWQPWLHKILEKSPSHRFESAREALEALAEEFGAAPIFAETLETTAPVVKASVIEAHGMPEAPERNLEEEDLTLDQAQTGQWRPLEVDYKALARPGASASPKQDKPISEPAMPMSIELPEQEQGEDTGTSWPWLIAAAIVTCLFVLLAMLLVRYLLL